MSLWGRLLGVRVSEQDREPSSVLLPDQTTVTRQENLERFIADQPEYPAIRSPEDFPVVLTALEERFDPESRPPIRRVGFRRAFKLPWIGGRH
jgi:hypothetical protein